MLLTNARRRQLDGFWEPFRLRETLRDAIFSTLTRHKIGRRLGEVVSDVFLAVYIVLS